MSEIEKVQYGSFVFNFSELEDKTETASQVNMYKLEIDADELKELGVEEDASKFPTAFFGYLTTNGRTSKNAWCWELDGKKGRKAIPLLSNAYKGNNKNKIKEVALKSAESAAKMIIENSPLKGVKTMKKTASIGATRRASTINFQMANKIAKSMTGSTNEFRIAGNRIADIIEKFEGDQADADAWIAQVQQEYKDMLAEIDKIQNENLEEELKKFGTDVKTAKAAIAKYTEKLDAYDAEMAKKRDEFIASLKGDIKSEFGVDVDEIIAVIKKSSEYSKKKLKSINSTVTQWETKVIQVSSAIRTAKLNIDTLKNILELGEARISAEPIYKTAYLVMRTAFNKFLKEKYGVDAPDELFSRTLIDVKFAFEDFTRTYGELAKESQETLKLAVKDYKDNFFEDPSHKKEREEMDGSLSGPNKTKNKKSSISLVARNRMVQASFLSSLKKTFSGLWNWTRDKISKAYDKLTSCLEASTDEMDNIISDFDKFNKNIKKTIAECEKALANMN